MTFYSPQWLLLCVPLLLYWVLAYRSLGRSRFIRLSMIATLAFALGDPRIDGAPGALRVAVVIDRSLSAGEQALTKGRQLARQLLKDKPEGALELHVIGFGRGASTLVSPGQPLDALGGLGLQDDSDLTAGLRLAAESAGWGAHLLLVSDGLYTGDDPLLDSAWLRARGIAVHALTVDRGAGPDVAITALQVPQRAIEGQRFSVGVEIDSPVAGEALLSITDRSGQPLATSPLHLSQGLRRYAVAVEPKTSGLHMLRAQVELAGDPRPQNNRARAAVVVEGAPRVRLYGADAEQGALFRALQSAGLAVELGAQDQPLTVADLQGVAAVVLENVELKRLGEGADAALEAYVRELGGGLIVTGGRSSYALGGYFRSRLEPILPVVMDRQDELRRPRVDMAIVLDRSGSMGATVHGGSTKMDLANRGAAEAIELLAPGDKLGVLAVDSAAHVVVPLQTIGSTGERGELRKKVLSIESGGGGIFVHTGLSVAMDMLLEGDAPTRHVILLSDAADAEEAGAYRGLIARWVDAGGSLSVIGLGTEQDPDAALLREIARLGGGEVYFTADAMQLPRVFAQDVMYVSRKTFLEQATPVRAARGLLSLGVTAADVPSIEGYNLTFLAQGAELVLESGDDNAAPLAAAWQRGAGKVLAVTFEADGPHTGAFASWAHYKRFFRGALEWVKAADQPLEVATEVRLDGRRATIEVELAPDAEPPAGAQAIVLDPDARGTRELPLSWSGPHTLSASFELEDEGVYQSVVNVPGMPPIALAPSVLPYSPEFAPRHAGRAGGQVMQALAEATGGGPLLDIDALDRLQQRAVRAGRPLWGLAIGLLLLLLLLDIAHRRGLTDPALTRAHRAAALPLRAAAGLRRTRRPKPITRGEEIRTPDDPGGREAAVDSPAEAPPASDPQPSSLQRAKKRARLR